MVLLLWIFYVLPVLCLLCLCTRLFICALWSPSGKGLTSCLSCVVSNCELGTFPLVSWVRFGIWLYRFLIFAPLLTLIIRHIWAIKNRDLLFFFLYSSYRCFSFQRQTHCATSCAIMHDVIDQKIYFSLHNH